MIQYDPTQNPNLLTPKHIAFAGNPVILKLCTTLRQSAEIRFLRICVGISIEFQVPPFTTGDFVRKQEFTMSAPTEGYGQVVAFNLSAYLSAMLDQRTFQAWRKGTPQTIGFLLYSIRAWEEYLTDANERVAEPSVNIRPADFDSFTAIPGRYTAMQRRYYAPEAVNDRFGPLGRLSSKPLGNDTYNPGETVPEGGKIVFGVWSETARQIPILINNIDTGLLFDCREGNGIAPVSDGFPLQTLSNGQPTPLPPGKYALTLQADTPAHNVRFFFTVLPATRRQPLYFEFVNHLGVLESIYCYGRRALSQSVEAEIYSRYQQKEFRPDVEAVRSVSNSEATFSTSTGPVTREWAAWFCEEFFKSERVFMYSNEWKEMIPVAISVKEDIDIYNESEAAIIDLDFTVTPLLEGFLLER